MTRLLTLLLALLMAPVLATSALAQSGPLRLTITDGVIDPLLYTSYESGFPRIYVLNVASVGRQELQTAPGEMAFSPRFSLDGQRMIYSLINGGNTDLYVGDIASGQSTRLTNAPSIETAPSFSPDGSQIVFESDRSGNQQLYIMSAGGGEPRRISFGEGRYSTPVWSPRGDLVAFTKQNAGRFHIGVMRTDRVLFVVDQSNLTPQGMATLDGQAGWLQTNNDYLAIIEGHADEQGTREYNLALGARRANAVREYLISKGVASGRIRTVSYGKERPIAVCSDESCYSQNRRAVTVISIGTVG
jgi:peptidoglycan-associated lipoprotein